MQTLLQDLRYASRQLWTNWGFTLLVVLTVSLGIGANTAIFSLVYGTLKPLPAPHPEQLVALAAQTKGDETGFRTTFPALQDFRQGTVSATCSASSSIRAELTSEAKPSRSCRRGPENFFPALGIRPVLGRLFEPGEGENPGADSTIVLGYTFWQKRYGDGPDIVGQQVRRTA